jgi:hypothetical protein
MHATGFSVRLAIGCVVGWLAAAVQAADPLTPAEQARYADLDGRSLQTFTNVDLADYLTLRCRALEATDSLPDVADDVGFFALKALNQPFRLNASRFDYTESDCVVLCERCCAMALCGDWDSYRMLSDRLRYKDGVVNYRNRNFSTLADWLPNNAWLFEDITPSLPGAATFTHIVRPKVFRDIAIPNSKYVRTIFAGHDWKSPNKETRTESYIPRGQVADAVGDLRTGDIVLTIYGIGKNAGCDHMGLIVRGEYNVAFVVHSTTPSVNRVPLLTFLSQFDRIAGFKFLRLRDNGGELAQQELGRLAASATGPAPDKEDAANRVLRDRRGTPAQ